MNHIALIAKPSLKKNAEILPLIIDYLEKKGKKVCLGKHIPEFVPGKIAMQDPFCADTDLVIVLGGDGTVLRTVRNLKSFQTLVFGINLGTLGFLSEIHPDYDKVALTLDKIFAGDFSIDQRMLLEVEVMRQNKVAGTFRALNEATIGVDGIARLITLNTTVNNRKLASYHADGLIISTPTGSTGYSLSAGGPIVYPTLPAMIITPVNPHAFTQKPIIIPDSKIIAVDVETRNEKAILTLDGQKNFNLEPGDLIKIKKHKETFKFIRLPGESYFRTIRKKLNWGKRLES